MQGERGREAVIHGGVAMVLASMEDDRRGERETCGGDEVRTKRARIGCTWLYPSISLVVPCKGKHSFHCMQERLPTKAGRTAKLRPRQSLHLHLSGGANMWSYNQSNTKILSFCSPEVSKNPEVDSRRHERPPVHARQVRVDPGRLLQLRRRQHPRQRLQGLRPDLALQGG